MIGPKSNLTIWDSAWLYHDRLDGIEAVETNLYRVWEFLRIDAHFLRYTTSSTPREPTAPDYMARTAPYA